MKRMRTLVCFVCSCAAALFGAQLAFAASESSKAKILFPVIEVLHAVLIKEWWISGAVFLAGAIYAAVFILRRTRKQSAAMRKEGKTQ